MELATQFGTERYAGRGTGVIPADMLRMLPQLAASLGREPLALYEAVGLDPAIMAPRGALPLFTAARLLELAGAVLGCPDIGMQLAALQRGSRTNNLFELVMRNSPTVGEALAYCSRHCRPYSGTVGVTLQRRPDRQQAFLRFEILAVEQPGHHHLIEQMMLRIAHLISDMSGGRVTVSEAWFGHPALTGPAAYRRHFGCPVRFRRPESGFFVDTGDLAIPSIDPDPQIHALATYFIENKFPELRVSLGAQVRTIISRSLPSGSECTRDSIAAQLGLHRRTMQRRLREEGTSFEAIRDEVRREAALRLLGEPSISLSCLAEMLGYAEVSALSRSFNRWFAASPRKLRRELAACAA